MFATAQSDARTVTRGRKANPLAWIAKPYGPSGLVGTILIIVLILVLLGRI